MDNIGNQMHMEHGVVGWFNEEKGYGFIQNEQGQFFIHYSEIKSEGFKTLKQHDRVMFEAADGPKGPLARNVSVVKLVDPNE
jgi:CspA family cold shock protein